MSVNSLATTLQSQTASTLSIASPAVSPSGDLDGDGPRVEHRHHGQGQGPGGAMRSALVGTLLGCGLKLPGEGPSDGTAARMTAPGERPVGEDGDGDRGGRGSGRVRGDLRHFMHALFEALRNESAQVTGPSSTGPAAQGTGALDATGTTDAPATPGAADDSAAASGAATASATASASASAPDAADVTTGSVAPAAAGANGGAGWRAGFGHGGGWRAGFNGGAPNPANQFAGRLAALVTQVAAGSVPSGLKDAFDTLMKDLQPAGAEGAGTGTGGVPTLQEFLTKLQQNLAVGTSASTSTGNLLNAQA